MSGRFKAMYRLCKKMQRRDLLIHTGKTTHTEGHVEASGSEWREFALNGDEGCWMGRDFWLRPYGRATLPLVLAMLLRILCTKMMRIWTRLATSGRNSLRRL